ncbi:MAG: tetratricopeptide repeat protein [Planctomycetes bacterium]|nr:tetratricopeptide repeat protein [Planctomycetota bacterium]
MTPEGNRQALHDLLDRRELLIVTGHGLSALPPTSIPRPDDIASAVIHAIGALRPGLTTHVERLLETRPSPHLILGLLFQGLSETFLEIFLPLLRRRPNRGHRLIARLVAAGHAQAVVTLNTDGCLERALQDEGLAWGRGFSVFAGEDSYHHYAKDQERPAPHVFKLQGSIERAQSLREELLEVELPPRSLRSQTLVALLGRFHPLLIGVEPSDAKGPFLSKALAATSAARGPAFVTGEAGLSPWEGAGACAWAGPDPVAVLEDLCRWKRIETPPPDPEVPELDMPASLAAWSREHGEMIEPHYLVGSIFGYLGRNAEALACLREGTRLAEREGDPGLLGAYELQVGGIHFKEARYREATAAYHRAMEGFRRDGDQENTIRATGNLAAAYLQSGNQKRALELFRQNLKALQDGGDPHEAARAHEGIGGVHFLRNEWNEAIESFGRALAKHHEGQDAAGVCRCQERIGWAYFQSHRLDLAESCFASCLKIYEEIGMAADAARIHSFLAQTLLAAGRREEGKDQADRAVQIYGQIGLDAERKHAEEVRRKLES